MSNNFLGVSHLKNDFNQRLTAKDPAFALRYELSILASKSMRSTRDNVRIHEIKKLLGEFK